MAALKRWLLDPQTPVEDLLGGAIAGIAILLIFRFGFGDPWWLAIGAGVAVTVASAAWSGWRRKRRRRA